jgi:hypothetical protein
MTTPLPPVPGPQSTNDKGMLTPPWQAWFYQLYNYLVATQDKGGAGFLTPNSSLLNTVQASGGASSDGEDGERGPPGPPGAPGPSVTGAQGPIGPAVFLEAPDGEPGDPGTPGPPGPQGNPGAQGSPGVAVYLEAPDGEPGQDGFPGPAGPAGVAGSQGVAGPAGPAIFLEGEMIEGDIGPPGVQGVRGIQGTAGSAGPPGPAIFLEGEMIEGDIGPPGVAGIAGAAGAAGSQGVAGPVGPAVFLEAEMIEGDLGPPGVQGIQGNVGSQGPVGPAVFLTADPGDDAMDILAGTSNAQFTSGALNNVTIGALTPTTGSFTSVNVTGSTAPANGEYLPAANTWGVATSSTLRMQISSNGLMGFGVAPSGWNTTVYNAIELINGCAIASYNTAGTPILWLGSNVYLTGSNNTYKVTAASGLYQINQGSHQWSVAPSGTAGTTITYTQAMTLNNNGQLSFTIVSGLSGAVVTLPAGTATAEPLLFTSGTNLTTAVAGAVEYDGTVGYFTPTANCRGVLGSEQIQILNTTYTLTSQTAAQKLFNATTNGTLTLPLGTFEFECSFALSSLNTGTSSVFGFAIGGTAVTTQAWEANCKSGTLATAAATSQTFNTAANTALVAANTSGLGYAKITGIIRVTTAGTIIPQVSLNTAAAAVVAVGSYFKIRPIGSSAVTNVGNWS